jgi:hypothetical protein
MVSSNLVQTSASTYTSSSTGHNYNSITGITSSLSNPLGAVTSSTSNYGLTDSSYMGTASGAQGATSYSGAAGTANISPLPIRANQINSTMPPLCQVLLKISFYD